MNNENLTPDDRLTHTPGPWWVEERIGGLQIQAKHRGEGSSYCVAAVNFWDNQVSNARLIAAAPELLEALRGLHDDLMDYITRNNLGGENNHWLVRARQAIKKATQP